jgi:hypothetical protein
MIYFGAVEGVTLTVQRGDAETMEVVRASEHGMTVYFDSPEDVRRRLDAWHLIQQASDGSGEAD